MGQKLRKICQHPKLFFKDTLDDYYDDYYEDHNEDSRIVGGFDAPDPIPWYIMLKLLTENGTKDGFICGGALITSRLGKKLKITRI